jgi:HD-GYP domain-containing protein (c-di-GMP phosphodiesterase class II)
MMSLKRYLKPALTRHMLEQADRLLPKEATLCLAYPDDGAVGVGPKPHDFPRDDPDAICRPLVLGGCEWGWLGLRVPGLATQPSERREVFEGLLGVLSFSMQGFIESESARRSIADETLSKYRELALLHRSLSGFNNSLKLREVTRALIQECQGGAVPADMGVLFLPDHSRSGFSPANTFGMPADSNLSAVPQSPLFREIVKTGKGEIVNELDADQRWLGGIPGATAVVAAPVLSPNHCEGVLILASRRPSPYTAAHLKHLSILTSVAGIAVSNAFNFESIQVLMDALLQALAEAIDSRDPFTAGHSERVAQLAAAFATSLNSDRDTFPDVHFSDDEIREIYYAGILHDVGKIGIKEEVLTKDSRLPEKLLEIIKMRLQLYSLTNQEYPWLNDYERLRAINASINPSLEDLEFVIELGRRTWEFGGRRMPLLKKDEQKCLLLRHGNLTAEERREIQRHPAESYRILQHIPFKEDFRNLLTAIRQHHERMDGSGYPDGVAGDGLLMQSRILAIVDIYDAITQERHYKAAASREEALMILDKEMREGKLDDRLVRHFARRIAEIEALADSIKGRRFEPLSAVV